MTGVKSTVVGVVTKTLTACGSWNKFEDIRKAFCFDKTFPEPEVSMTSITGILFCHPYWTKKRIKFEKIIETLPLH